MSEFDLFYSNFLNSIHYSRPLIKVTASNFFLHENIKEFYYYNINIPAELQHEVQLYCDDLVRLKGSSIMHPHDIKCISGLTKTLNI